MKYGECLSIDYVRKILRKRDASGKHFIVGFFTGKDKEGKIILFGVSILSSEIFIYHKKAIEIFFKLMFEKIPMCIIVPDSRQILKALDLLRE